MGSFLSIPQYNSLYLLLFCCIEHLMQTLKESSFSLQVEAAHANIYSSRAVRQTDGTTW